MVQEQVSLTQRQKAVLRAVIHDYIDWAEPVGSRSVSRRYAFHLGPASIRNIMADLEELGYLAQPHTSAGRVPTDRGYRFYVDTLMDPTRLTPEEEGLIERRFTPARGQVEGLMRATSQVLGTLSRCAGIVLAPRLEQLQVKRLEFVGLAADRTLLILVATSGVVHHKAVTLDEVLSQEELSRVARYLNELLQGLTLTEVRQVLVAKMAEEKAQYDQLLRRALLLWRKTVEGEQLTEIYIGGASQMMEQPEFADTETMRAIFAAFEEKSRLVKILDRCLEDAGLTVTIGRELGEVALQEFSVVASPYFRGSAPLGALAVVGPTRMPYDKVVPLVDYTARLVSRLLTDEAS
ncbi:MAG: heat-inducible transcriptional repressor HrcA [Candidatus Methylomirabilales bacterium]